MIIIGEPVKLLWTGGWDSTFRLIQLILFYNKKVQPYYFINRDRKSSFLEIRAQNQISLRLREKYKQVDELLLPTIFIDRFSILPDPVIEESFEQITKNYPFGIQYKYMAAYCRKNNIFDMEIGNEIAEQDEDNKVRKALGEIQKTDTDAGYYYQLSDKFMNSNKFTFFGYFRFGNFDNTKRDMLRISKELGFYDVMKLTWFCFSPRGHLSPCGICVPCQAVIKEGLKNRIPLIGRLRYLILIKWEMKQFIDNNKLANKIFHTIKKFVSR